MNLSKWFQRILDNLYRYSAGLIKYWASLSTRCILSRWNRWTDVKVTDGWLSCTILTWHRTFARWIANFSYFVYIILREIMPSKFNNKLIKQHFVKIPLFKYLFSMIVHCILGGIALFTIRLTVAEHNLLSFHIKKKNNVM